MKARPPILQQTLIFLGNISASHPRTLTSRNMLTRGSKPTDQTIQTPSKPPQETQYTMWQLTRPAPRPIQIAIRVRPGHTRRDRQHLAVDVED